MSSKTILRCSSDGVVNIPKETYKELNWKLNEPVEVCIAEIPYVDENDNVLVMNEVCIRRVKDLSILEDTEEDNEEWKRKTNIIFKSIKEECNGTI
tara:strand:- start:21784 stop:22071 length:288 start_codon:yes stop_codon:yes gene_type:complete